VGPAVTKSPLTRLIQVYAVVVAAALWAAGSVPAQAGVRIQGPTVVSGWKDGPVSAPVSASLSQVAALPLPAGRWIIWAKLYVSNDNPDIYSQIVVRCRLGVATIAGFLGHTGTVQVGHEEVSISSKHSIALNTSMNFSSDTGKVALRCAADEAGASLHWIKIMAMRVGTIGLVDMETGNKSSYGTGGPVAILGERAGPINLPKDVTTSIGKLTLAPGRWAVRASFSLDEDKDPFFNCRLNVNGVSADRQDISPDEPRVVIVMDTAVWSTTSIKINLTCHGFESAGWYTTNEFIRDVRISAVKLGTLTTFDKRGLAHAHGSGTPKAAFRAVSERTLSSHQWMDVAWLDVGAGKWMVLAKAQVASSSAVTCQLTAFPDYDQSATSAFSELALPFGVVHTFAAPGRVRLRCIAPELPIGDSELIRAIRLTAFQLGSLQNVPL
jgi:hypothetical protein